MSAPEMSIDDLRARLLRHPPERYPVQHATAQYHLGVALANAGQLDEAEPALARAVELFEGRLPAEHAKATNSFGAVLRMMGRLEDAAKAFERAAAVFQEEGLGLEEGAARYNLGLVRREDGDEAGAADEFRRAVDLLDRRRVPGQAAAARRELGTSLLVMGAVDEAIEAVTEAEDLARQAGDMAGMGAAANALGLAHLGAGREAAAVQAFRRSVGANPRGVRPEAHAMAKANLALAYEGSGDAPRARLAALQALGSPPVPEAVRSQAEAVLARLGAEPGQLAEVLDTEPREAWPAMVREEVVRWTALPEPRCRAEVAAWLDAQLARDQAATDLAAAWLGALLELPPEDMSGLIRVAVQALAGRPDEERRRLRSRIEMAMARFHVPQLLRLRESFERIGSEPGAAW